MNEMKTTEDRKIGRVIVIVAPSGTGKSTLIQRIKNEFPQLKESVSYTTRPMRKGEANGINYFYISVEEFLAKKEKSDFLEWAKVHSNYYGTAKSFVEGILNSGQSILLDLDVQGADAMKTHFRDKAKIIFIEPPSLEILAQRLYNRGTESKEAIAERLRNAEREIIRKHDYDYLLMNDQFEESYERLRAIFKQILEK